MPDQGSPLPAGCEGKKIDFLFVISNSNTMEIKQERLLAAFPGSMDAIEAKDIDNVAGGRGSTVTYTSRRAGDDGSCPWGGRSSEQQACSQVRASPELTAFAWGCSPMTRLKMGGMPSDPCMMRG